ncbi:DNA topoisomerase type II, partial [Pseudoloma neurophilia]
NSICTIKGGTHVQYVLDQIIEPVIEKLKKKEKGLNIKPQFVKNNIFLFLNCLIENPSFDSQTKETLTLRSNAFGSSIGEIKPKIFLNILELIGENIINIAQQKNLQQLKKTGGNKKTKIQHKKLDDANKAGTKDSKKCSLFLTEGDSAKTFAMCGIESIKEGRNIFGAFPLKGKLINVRDASHEKIMKNEELNNLKKIIGLQHGKKYETVETLRYGTVIIMTDQDYDGSHIKGLLINFFEHYFPSLLKIEGFLKEFITPIIKATKIKRSRAGNNNGG